MIAVDWGTTKLRAYRLDAQGSAIESRERPEGVMALPPGGFPAALDAITQGWESDVDRVLMSGMVGSRQGWLEVPYVDCPADLAAIARGVRRVEWRRGATVLICPGITCRDSHGVPDVIRGEEVQVIGALALAADRKVGSILVAGTHAKHVQVTGSVIVGFSTFMTGEVFAVLKEHSILGRTMASGSGAFDAPAFARGVARARETGGLLHHVFGARALVLQGELAGSAASDYLSGILIGHTLLAAAPQPPALIIGAPELAQRYCSAAAQLGIAAHPLASERATLAGLAAVRRVIRD